MKIILASASPRRRELLKQIGLECEVVVSEVEEVIDFELEPYDTVERLAEYKARAALDKVCKDRNCEQEEFVIIGADTVVSYEGSILGKPKDAQDAVNMLKKLQGHTHTVYTGVSLLYKKPGEAVRPMTFHEETEVTFYYMTEKEINTYVETGDPLDKAGAYGIQGFCARYISGIDGDYNNVVGLPVGRLYQSLVSLLNRFI